MNILLDSPFLKRRLDAVVELMGFGDIPDHHHMTLDYTTKKVITIASVLIFNPEVLIPDEPTGGLDEVGRRMLSKVIHLVHRKEDTTMAMNSVDTSKGRLRGTYTAIMIPMGVAINYIGGLIASSLSLQQRNVQPAVHTDGYLFHS